MKQTLLIIIILAVLGSLYLGYLNRTKPQEDQKQTTTVITPQPTPTFTPTPTPTSKPTTIPKPVSGATLTELTVSNVEPGSVPSNYSSIGKTKVEITGSGFLPGLTARLVGASGRSTSLRSVTYESSIKASAHLPAGLGSGYYHITVINPDGTSHALNNAFLITSQVE